MSPWVWLLICVAAIVVLCGLGLLQKQIGEEGFTTVDLNTLMEQRQQLQYEGERRYNDLALLQPEDPSAPENIIRDSLQQVFPVPSSSDSRQSLIPIDLYKAADDGSNKIGPTLEQTGVLAKKIELCERISHMDCEKLGDPAYIECGICHKDGINSKGKKSRGGMYISAEDQIRANEMAAANGTSVAYTPTFGSCDPKDFTMRREACSAKRDTENCANQIPSAGNSCGKCIETQNMVFMGAKPSEFDAILHVSHSGFYLNSLFVRHTSVVAGSTPEDILIPNSLQSGGASRSPLVPSTIAMTLREGDTIDIGVYGMPQIWCAWLSSADGTRTVGINIGVDEIYPKNGIVPLGDTQSVKVNAFFSKVPGWEAYKQTVPPTVLWYTRRNDIVPPAIVQADAIIKTDDTITSQDITSGMYIMVMRSENKKIVLSGANMTFLPKGTGRITAKLDNGSSKASIIKDNAMILTNVQVGAVALRVTVPATLTEPHYDIDLELCPSGPMILTGIGVGKMDNNPCFDRKGKFQQTKECVQQLFSSAGGTEKGTLYPTVEGFASAKALVVDNNFSKTVDNLNNLGSIAMYGTDNNGAPTGFAKQKDAALQMLGVNMTNPCDGPSPYSNECLNYLWKTSGQTTPDNIVDPTKIDSLPYSYCTANGEAAPLKSQENVDIANEYETVSSIRQYYNSLFMRSHDDSDFDVQAAAMKQCYGVTLKAPELGKLTCPSQQKSTSITLQRGQIVGSVNIPRGDYTLSFTITMRGTVGDWGSIIHVTKGANCCNSGDRAPGIWTSPGGTTLHIVFGDETDGNWRIDSTNPLPIGQPVNVSITAQGSSVSATIGNKTYSRTQPTRRPTGNNYNIYMSDPWYEPANATIENIKYVVDGVNVPISSTIRPMVMYGDWIGRDTPVQTVKQLNTGENVYMIVDDRYVKMVTQSGVAKYFSGTDVNLFNPNSWNSYTDATGHYLLKPV